MTPEDIAKLPYRRNVGVMVLNADGHVWVGQRKDNYKDAWQMPQGGVDDGETPVQAALRELCEETGIKADRVEVVAETAEWIPYDLPHDLVPRLWKGRFRGQTQKYFLMRFLGEDAEIDIEQEHQEFSRWKWMRPDDLIDRIVPFKKHTYETVFAQFRFHFQAAAQR